MRNDAFDRRNAHGAIFGASWRNARGRGALGFGPYGIHVLDSGGVKLYVREAYDDVRTVRVAQYGSHDDRRGSIRICTQAGPEYGLTDFKEGHFFTEMHVNSPEAVAGLPRPPDLLAGLRQLGFTKAQCGSLSRVGLPFVLRCGAEPRQIIAYTPVRLPMLDGWRAPVVDWHALGNDGWNVTFKQGDTMTMKLQLARDLGTFASSAVQAFDVQVQSKALEGLLRALAYLPLGAGLAQRSAVMTACWFARHFGSYN